MLLYNHIELIYYYVPHILQVMSLTTSSLINTEAKNTEPGRQVFRTAFAVLSLYISTCLVKGQQRDLILTVEASLLLF